MYYKVSCIGTRKLYFGIVLSRKVVHQHEYARRRAGRAGQGRVVGWSRSMTERREVPGSSPAAWKRVDFLTSLQSVIFLNYSTKKTKYNSQCRNIIIFA